MVGRQYTQSHHGSHHRDTGAFCQLLQQFLGTGTENTTAGTDHRVLGLSNGLSHTTDLIDIALVTGLVSTNIYRLRIDGVNDLLLHITGNVDENGALTAGGSDMEGLLDDARNLPGILYQVAMLNERCYGTGHVYFLENVLTQLMAGYLAGNGDHRNGVHIGGGNTGDQVGRTGTGCYHAHTHLAAGTGIAAGHMAGILLGTHQGILNVRRCYRIHRFTDGGASITKHVSHALTS